MFLTNINHLFYKHGKVAFTILTLVIIIPFVFYFSGAPSDVLSMFFSQEAKSRVSINGKRLSRETLQKNIMKSLIPISLKRGRKIDFRQAASEDRVVSIAIKRLLLLKEANKRGIKISERDIAGYIRELPIFQQNGNFSTKKYDKYVKSYLSKFRLNNNDLEQSIKEELKIQILKSQNLNSVIINEEGAKTFYNNKNRKFDLKVANFKAKDLKKDINYNQKDLKKFFRRNKSDFLLPARFKVLLTKFSFDSYKKAAEKSISGNKEKEIEEKAEKLAQKRAQEFAVKSFKTIESEKAKNIASDKIFKNLAKNNDYNILKVSKWIEKGTNSIPNVGELPKLVKSITNLHKDQPITNAVKGKNAYYVACLVKKQKSRVAKFSRVIDEVKNKYLNSKAIKLARKKAKSSKVKLENKKDIKNSSVKFKDLQEIDMSNPYSFINIKNGRNIVRAAQNTGKNQISNVINTEEGAMLVYVDDIIFPSDKDFEENKNNIMENYKDFKQRAAWANYLNYLRNNAKVKFYEVDRSEAKG